jgi:hypothetical protein
MRNRLSIFSSRLFGSALIWTVLAIALIEWRAGRVLPARYPSHGVDQMLYDLDHGRIPSGDTVCLGDSVGLQVARALLRQTPESFVSLASNGGIEMSGQYHVFRRYLAGHPAPKRVILMMLNPIHGQLRGRFTENYVQRGFLHWREIAELTRARRSLSFGLVMVAYKLSPVFCHRLRLQGTIPLLETPLPWSGNFKVADISWKHSDDDAEYGLIDLAARRLEPRRGEPTISEVYFRRFADLLESKGIAWLYLSPPVKMSSDNTAPDGIFGYQMRRIAAWKPRYPALHIHEHYETYPDEWFSDDIHVKPEYLAPIAADYAKILDALGFGANPP